MSVDRIDLERGNDEKKAFRPRTFFSSDVFGNKKGALPPLV
jgi:hypothetical protein